ncbi:MAG: hypothetical protein HYS86_02770 [Candidatus Chisholmbacteria bacterium]|nr:hypothetical protein [Candidatus Chisholmbacteria bacterium]
MYAIKKCDKVEIDQGALYLGESTEKRSVGYLELKPHSSLTLHHREAIENLVQVKNSCVMVVFDKSLGTTHRLDEGDRWRIEPKGTWHIHVNPFSKTSLTYWHFEGDVREVIEAIRRGGD